MDVIHNKENLKKALKQQQNEINDYTIYKLLSLLEKDGNNKKIFEQIAKDEKNHYDFWVKVTNRQIKAQNLLVLWYIFLIRIFGTSFALRSLEKRETGAKEFYEKLFELYPEAKKIYEDETEHELALIDILHDKKLIYAGAIVLGMNDALVELTGTLSGMAFAFNKSMIVGLTGLIIGISGSLSMAASAYLEANENPNKEIKPVVYALYTGFSYFLTTTVLAMPFFILNSITKSLILMFICAFIAILLYNFYISVAKDLKFTKRVFQMLTITSGVSIISFLFGYFIKYYFGVEI